MGSCQVVKWKKLGEDFTEHVLSLLFHGVMRAEEELGICFHGDFDIDEKEMVGKHLHSCRIAKKLLTRKEKYYLYLY